MAFFKAHPDLIGARMSSEPVPLFRYLLWRVWDTKLPVLIWVMLNPSTADSAKNDATIRLTIHWAKSMGYGGCVVVNLFAYRSTSPSVLVNAKFDIIGPDNDATILEICDASRYPNSRIFAAWGTGGSILDRDKDVVDIITRQCGREIWCLTTTAMGQPRHPLRIPYITKPLVWKKAYR